MKYAYYPGCSLHATAVDYDESTQAVARKLGIELVEVPEWSCCGSTPAHATDALLDPAAYGGRAPEQVDEFLAEHVEQALERHRDALGDEGRVTV